MEVSGQLHAQALYPQGKSPWYPLDRRLGGTQSRSGHSGEEKNFQPLPGLEPPIIQPVAQRCTTELSRLFQPNRHIGKRMNISKYEGKELQNLYQHDNENIIFVNDICQIQR
jgi:hypothetical protein